MKSILDRFLSYCDMLGKVRAAGVLARMGRYEEAKRIMINE
jgi:hypothetical protein